MHMTNETNNVEVTDAILHLGNFLDNEKEMTGEIAEYSSSYKQREIACGYFDVVVGALVEYMTKSRKLEEDLNFLRSRAKIGAGDKIPALLKAPETKLIGVVEPETEKTQDQSKFGFSSTSQRLESMFASVYRQNDPLKR